MRGADGAIAPRCLASRPLRHQLRCAAVHADDGAGVEAAGVWGEVEGGGDLIGLAAAPERGFGNAARLHRPGRARSPVRKRRAHSDCLQFFMTAAAAARFDGMDAVRKIEQAPKPFR